MAAAATSSAAARSVPLRSSVAASAGTSGAAPGFACLPAPGRCCSFFELLDMPTSRCRTVPGSAANGSTANRFCPRRQTPGPETRRSPRLPLSPMLSLRSTAKTTNSSRVGRTRFEPARASTSRTTINRPQRQRADPLPAGEIDQAAMEEIDQDRQHASPSSHQGRLELESHRWL